MIIKRNLNTGSTELGWTFQPVWTHDLKVDIFVRETSLTVCQQQRTGTGRCGKRNQFWRTRRSKEQRQKKKGGDELSFPSTDRKSRLLTKNRIFPVCVIHIRNSVIHLCSLSFDYSWINFIFSPILKGNNEPGMPLIWPWIQSI